MSISIQLQTTQAALDGDWSATPGQPIERQSVAPLQPVGLGGKAGFVEPVTAVLTLSLVTLGYRLFEYFKKKGPPAATTAVAPPPAAAP